MNKVMLKTILVNNSNIMVEILQSLGAHSILLKDNKRIHFGMPENRGGRSHCIFVDKFLTHKDYPNDITEDFIDMVSRLKKVPYDYVCNYIMMFATGNIKYCPVDYEECIEDRPLEEYDIKILDTYPKIISELFLKDGIPPTTQSDFGIRFSETQNRILIPIHQKGKLVGIFGRYNQKNIDEEFIAKYLPILPYQKGKVLFPYDMNSEYVRKGKFCYLVESEKTPMLMYKYNWRNVFALGGNAVKAHQIELLKELGVERIILALDKGLTKGYVEYTAMRLKEHGFDVYYIDVESIPYLPNTDCIFDLDNKLLIEDTIRKYIRRVE